MRWGNVTFIAALFGLIWGSVWMVLTSLMTMLVTGVVMVPAIGAAAISGFILGIGYVAWPVARRTRQHLALFGIMSLVLVGLFSGFHPFGIGLDKTLITQLVAIVIWACLLVISLY